MQEQSVFKFVIRYLNLITVFLLLFGLSISIGVADNDYWIYDSYSYLATYAKGRIIFTTLLITLAILKGVFTYYATRILEERLTGNNHTIRRIRLTRMIFTSAFLCLIIAGIFPMNHQFSMHTIGGVLYFALYPFALLLLSTALRRSAPKFYNNSKIVFWGYVLGGTAFLLTFESVVPVETFCFMLIAVWTFLLNRYLLKISYR
ncbi:MAG: DUF998 domain-containing protein [Candidatus Dojkabacteria bacterium]|nr:DUF998 domain-containing protein [Candidatus Dojkabacteria bacterium]